jgi:4-hydroxybenzoate polyprenyltransferase/phosphoserine phosphatase
MPPDNGRGLKEMIVDEVRAAVMRRRVRAQDPGAAQKVVPLHAPSVRPLCVDMDGTLLATDVLWESLVLVAKTKPTLLLRLPVWLIKGKAFVKRQLACHVTLDPSHLPYHQSVVAFLTRARQAGREIILTTASDRVVAERVARHLGVFSAVLASDGEVNLTGGAKLSAILHHLNGAAFDYIGNSTADLPILRHASTAMLVRPSRRLLNKARETSTIEEVFFGPPPSSAVIPRALRIHQWSKNALLFVPLVLAHEVTDLERLFSALLAFGAFSLAASAVYVLNDLLDLETDRQHPYKRRRPFASGLLSIRSGVTLAPLAVGASLLIGALLLPGLFVIILLLYLGVTTAYSFKLKRIAILDVLLLAGVYTLRVLAGAIATHVRVSPWFLAFSMFFFLSLAFVKRYAELHQEGGGGQVREYLSARGYLPNDVDLLRTLGATSGYLAVTVLALYIQSPDTNVMYRRPDVLWLICPLLLYWITRVWFLAHRGQMHGDPVVFALTDRASYALAGLVAATLIVASLG